MYPGIQSLVAGVNDGELKRRNSSYSSGDHRKEKSWLLGRFRQPTITITITTITISTASNG